MRNKTRRAKVIELLQKGQLNSKQIAARADCSTAYVYQLRWELKKKALKAQQPIADWTFVQEEQETAPQPKTTWLHVAVVFLTAAALLALYFTVRNI